MKAEVVYVYSGSDNKNDVFDRVIDTHETLDGYLEIKFISFDDCVQGVRIPTSLIKYVKTSFY